MYKGLFDEKNRLQLIQSEEGVIQPKGMRQSGEFESNILCLSCDNEKLGRLERYASLMLYDGNPKVLEFRETPDGMIFLYCAEIDYKQFKLFLLSILWRASISTRPIFREVSLGPYEERLRQMLLNEDPGQQMTFPCVILTYLNIKDLPSDIVAQPARAKVDSGTVYKFMIGGMIYIFAVTKQITPDWFAEAAINSQGEMKIMFASPQLARNMLGNMMGLKLN